MQSCDTNILFAALNADADRHAEASRYLTSVSHDERFALCELVLIELYGLLRNPLLNKVPAPAEQAADAIAQLRSNPSWVLLDYPGPAPDLAGKLWQRAARPDFSRRAIYDTRLALTLRHFGVKQFATRNTKDFQDFGFERVWDPLTR